MSNRINIDKEIFTKQFADGATQVELAKYWKCGVGVIALRIKEFGLVREKRASKHVRNIEIDKETFIKQVTEGYTIPELEKYWHCSKTAIMSRKKEWNLLNKSPNSSKRSVDLGTKICKRCNIEKELSEFYSNGYYPTGTKKYKPNCKPCENIHKKELYYEKLLRILKRNGRKYECENCGYKVNHAALCFHHNQGIKNFELTASKACGKSEEVVETEVQLCVLLCHNCHMEEHYPHLKIE